MTDVSTRRFTRSLTGLKTPAVRLAIHLTKKSWSGDLHAAGGTVLHDTSITQTYMLFKTETLQNNIETKPLLENRVIDNYARMFGNESH